MTRVIEIRALVPVINEMNNNEHFLKLFGYN